MATRKATKRITVNDLLKAHDASRKLPAEVIPEVLEVTIPETKAAGKSSAGNPTKALYSEVVDFGTGVSRENAVKIQVYRGPEHPDNATGQAGVSLRGDGLDLDVVALAEQDQLRSSKDRSLPPAAILTSTAQEWADPRATCFRVILPAGTDDEGNAYPIPATVRVTFA